MPSLITLLTLQLVVPPAAYAPPAPPPPPLQHAARFRNHSEVIRPKDYPRTALRAGTEGVVRYTVAISRKGRPTDCRVIESSGDAALDARSCAMILKRAKFYPATDPAGRPIAGTLTARVFWRMPR